MPDEASTAFGPLTIGYDPRGLRPRPWTTMQSLWAAQLLAELPEGDVLELCAGVGHIGLLTLVESDRCDGGDLRTRRHLVQVDDDETVCRLAERNAEQAGLGPRVEVRRGVAQECLEPGERFALVIADPPWVPTAQVARYPDDPPSAIDGGPDGLDVVRALLPVMERHLHTAGAALLQLGGATQVEEVRRIVQRTGVALRVVDARDAPGAAEGAVAHLVVA